jgi:cell division protein FtsB
MAVLVLSLFLNGTVWRIWGLRRDLSTIQQQIISSREQSKHLDLQIKQAKDPSFIERQAKDKLDMVGEQDLVFVFTDGPQN